MRKRIYSLIAICVLIICLTSACGKQSDDSADVHVFYYTFSDTYISSVRNALDKKLKEANIKFHDYDGNSSQTTQTEQVQTSITKGAKLIIVNIVNTGSDDAADGIVTLAKNANIPVIFFNREVSNSVVNSYDKCVFIGTDAAEAGHLQGEMIGNYVDENFDKLDLNGDGEISYILFKGEEGNNEAIYRTRYSVDDANEILKERGRKALKFYDSTNPNKYLVDKNSQWSATAANEYMTTALTSYSESNNNMIELVICNNDGMAEGAVTALNTAGYNTGGEKTIPVFGVDATDAAKELIKAGKMAGTIKQDADGMADAIARIAKNTIEGKELLDSTDDMNIDANADKIRISYAIYLGEE